MRADGKPEGLRQAMSWLHTWSGLVLGWLLYAIFFTGTLSYFQNEITLWMKPELHRSARTGDDAAMAEAAVAGMHKLAPEATTFMLSLPDSRQSTVAAVWRNPGAPEGRAGMQRAELDAATGEAITARQTLGGSFLYRFHFELYGLPRVWTRWLVSIATAFMFVAILSGVITHKKIFTDFFTFRPRKGQRSWLDAHNATAVLSLPFHLMITFSGLLLLMALTLPWAIDSVYKGDRTAYFNERRGTAAPLAALAVLKNDPKPAAERAPLAPIGPMLAEAARQWPDGEVAFISATGLDTPRPTVELRERQARSLADRGARRRLLFDGISGQPKPAPEAAAPGWPMTIYNVLTAAHMGRFADAPVRWVMFLFGVTGTLMAATGMALWVVKREPDRRKLGRTPWGHRLVMVLNAGVIGGLSVAVAAYFWLNRLLPFDLAGRQEWEVRGFFIVWLLCLLHSFVRSYRRAWLELTGLAALLFALLPLLNGLTGGAALPQSLARGQWGIAGFDLVMLALAALHGVIAWHLRPSAQPIIKPKAAPRPAAASSAKSAPPASAEAAPPAPAAARPEGAAA